MLGEASGVGSEIWAVAGEAVAVPQAGRAGADWPCALSPRRQSLVGLCRGRPSCVGCGAGSAPAGCLPAAKGVRSE